MKTKPNKLNQGFTIIEVMIVLAIAALILLIVFLAVPALQRNSRNTQYRSEAARILGGANELVANSSGAIPCNSTETNGTGGTANNGTATCTTPPVGNDALTIWNNANKPGNIQNLSVASSTGTAANFAPGIADFKTAILYTQATCNVSTGTINGGAAVAPASPAPAKSLALAFNIEGAGGTIVPQCQSS